MFAVETFQDCQPSVLRQRFAVCKVGKFIRREIDLQRISGREIVNLDQRPFYSPCLYLTEIREVSKDELYVLFTVVHGNDLFLSRVETLLRQSAEDVTAEDYDGMPEEQRRLHFYNTPFSLHTIGADGGVDFSEAATLRLVMPEVLDPHLEEFERRASFNATLFKTDSNTELKIPLAQELRRGSESNTMFHTLFKLEGNELGI